MAKRYKYQFGGQDSTDFFNQLADNYIQQYSQEQAPEPEEAEEAPEEVEVDDEYADLQSRYDELEERYNTMEASQTAPPPANKEWDDNFLNFLFSPSKHDARVVNPDELNASTPGTINYKPGVKGDGLTGRAQTVLGSLGELVGDLTVTSTTRSAEENRAVGGSEKSYHLTGDAIDLRPTPGLDHFFTSPQGKQYLAQQGYEVIDERNRAGHGAHWHLEPKKYKFGGGNEDPKFPMRGDWAPATKKLDPLKPVIVKDKTQQIGLNPKRKLNTTPVQNVAESTGTNQLNPQLLEFTKDPFFYKNKESTEALKDIYLSDNREFASITVPDTAGYMSAMKLLNARGFPDVRTLRSVNEERAYYLPSKNTMYANTNDQIIAEASHSMQTWLPFHLRQRWDKIVAPYSNQDEYDAVQYDTPGTSEHEAHRINQPKLMKEYDKDYLLFKYETPMALENAHNKSLQTSNNPNERLRYSKYLEQVKRW